MPSVKLNESLENLYGVGPKFAERLKKFGIKNVRDLLWHFPFRYDDFSSVSKIADLKIGQIATISGIISQVKLYRTWKKRMFIVEALIADDTGSIKAIWFNQRFLLSILKKGKLVSLAGKVAEDPKGGASLQHPTYELLTGAQLQTASDEQLDTKHTGRLVPVYPETRKLTSKGFRYLIKPLLENVEKIDDPIPEEVLNGAGFPEINEALFNVHFPEILRQAQDAKKRFAFEDLFLLQLANLRQKLKLAKEKAQAFEIGEKRIDALLLELPFSLTESQKKSLWEILDDLKKPHPMNRLLQGDVGSGKTIVAAIAGLIVAEDSFQTAFMAPTEVLARQHFQTFKKFFKNFGGGVALLVSSGALVFYGDGLESEIKKPDLIKKISSGEIKIIIGTHALIQKNVKFKDLALIVIDEQHRFGIRQRGQLVDQSPECLPHFLSMSATPIPRTLSLTVFGDLNLSIISELPKGRKEIITKIVAPENRDKAYAFIRGQVKKGRQAFVICPRIDPPEENPETSQEVKMIYRGTMSAWETKAVKEEYEKLVKKVFPDLRVGLLHGKLKAGEKTSVMDGFKKGKIDILVSTSVVEVGVDIPNATIMMIEGSERFGLAQLYQFRGRVGRGEHQSFCFLFSESSSQTTLNRLNSLIEAKNGFELAEKDLEIRGPGEFLGQSQTGLPDLAMKSIQDPELVKTARETAEKLLKTDPDLLKYPALLSRVEGFAKETHLE